MVSAMMARLADGRPNQAQVGEDECDAPAVANTSKKPSTHRCTSHQRQYSIIE